MLQQRETGSALREDLQDRQDFFYRAYPADIVDPAYPVFFSNFIMQFPWDG